MPSVLDRELTDSANDAFGHQQFADALKDLIESCSNKPPFSIGLLGPWGTGKSTIKELYLCSLQADKSGSRGRRRADLVHAITFNAWRFGGEQDLKRSLLREAFRQLGGDEAALRTKLFEQVNNVVHKTRPLRDWAGEAFGQILGSAALFLVLFLATLLVSLLLAHFWDVTHDYALATIVVASLFGSGWLGKHVVDLRIRTPATYLPQTSISFPATSAEEYEALLTEQIDEFRARQDAKCERLVIFVDDLDRLSAPEMVAGLDAVRTFLELPFNAAEDGFGVVFVISCDEAKIAEALHRGRGPMGAAGLPGSVFSRADARRYLDRLFQFRLEIPRFPKQDMRQFALTRLSGASSIAADLEDKDVPLQAVIDRLIHVDVQSPRNAIQLLNAFIQSWWIGRQRERSGAGSSAHGVLHAGAVTDHPLSLAAMCVLRVDFPDFYECVQHRPEFLHEFRSVVFGTEGADAHAHIAQDMMNTFLAKADDGTLISNVQPEYRKLRQYLASVQDLRWPKRLQPLLRLAEDPVTRRYGDGAATIHDALVSGDIQGVLEGFGRDLDEKELSQDDATLLGDLTDTLPQETEARRLNASRVLARLRDRIPENRRRLLLTPLVRQMVGLVPVRMDVGPSAARQIIHDALPQDRREVAEQFVSDLLHGDDIRWTNPSGGSPNLDEATKLVRETVDLALEVRRNDGLPEPADSTLREWLLTRRVQIPDQSQTLPFSELDSLVDQHADHLLAHLGSDYSDQAISTFESDEESIVSPQATLERALSVFDQMADSGQEQRAILWPQSTRLVSVRSVQAVHAALRTAATYRDLADAVQARDFVSALASRLIQHFEDADAVEQDSRQLGHQFNDLLTEWTDHLDEETGLAIVPLLSAWALHRDCTDIAVPSLDLLRNHAKSAWDESIGTLLQNDAAVVPPKTCSYLGRHVLLLADDHTRTLIERLDAVVSRDPPDADASRNYRAYVRSIPPQAWSQSQWSVHLEGLFAQTQNKYSNPAYLAAMFPSVVDLLDAAPEDRAAQLIVPLFANATSAPDAYVILHAAMAEHWPATDAPIGNYSPDELAERACEFIQQYPDRPGLGDVLTSLISLSERGVTGDTVDHRIASVIPIIWRTDRQPLVENVRYVAKVLAPSHTADILTGAQPPDLSQGDLATFLRQIVAAYDADACFAVLRATLGQQPSTLFDAPDGAVGYWLAAAQDTSDAIERMALGDGSFNDEQHRRVAAKVTDAFWTSGDMQSVEVVLKRTDEPNTRGALIERLHDISDQLLSAGDRAVFSSRLIASLPALSGDELASVTDVVRKLGGQGALEEFDSVLDELDDDQMHTLQTAFPSSKILAKIKAR